MTTTILLAVLTGLLFYVAVMLRRATRQLDRLHAATIAVRDELRELRLASRARVGSVSYGDAPNQSGPTIVRTGRAARSKRVVAGGDASSEQHRILTEQLGGDDEPDVSSD